MKPEVGATFPCFGATCAVRVAGDGPLGSAEDAVAFAMTALLGWHERFTRFAPDSALSRLNADPRRTVPVPQELARFALAARSAADASGGLVDPTQLDRIAALGYRSDLTTPLPLALALRLAPPRRPGGPDPGTRWRALTADPVRGTVTRPPGLKLDSGGIAKGLFGDWLAERLRGHARFAVDCGGDLRVGGTAGDPRELRVADPFGGPARHAFILADGAIATSGIGRRSWLDPDGRPAHHLLDPATGRPAFTGIVQATALAPTGAEAELRAKAALLAGPGGASRWLADGGLLVLDDGSQVVLEAGPRGAVLAAAPPA